MTTLTLRNAHRWMLDEVGAGNITYHAPGDCYRIDGEATVAAVQNVLRDLRDADLITYLPDGGTVPVVLADAGKTVAR